MFDLSATYPTSIELPNKHMKCNICNEFFTAKKYLDTYVRLKHNTVGNVDWVDTGKETEPTEGNNEVAFNDNDEQAKPREDRTGQGRIKGNPALLNSNSKP